MKANTIRDVAYAAATVNNAPFQHNRGSLLSFGQKLCIIFIPRCHKSFDDVTAQLGPFSLYARSRVKEARIFPNLKIHEKKIEKCYGYNFFAQMIRPVRRIYVGRKKYLGASWAVRCQMHAVIILGMPVLSITNISLFSSCIRVLSFLIRLAQISPFVTGLN